MKKHRISKRILAMMLVICMMFTMLPANANADETHEKDTIGTTETGLNLEKFDYDDKIIWPIEIYDYENDGMLFEYAGATGDTNVRNELDKKGEYVYMPDLTTNYYANYTNPIIDDSYVVNNWIELDQTAGGWGLTPGTGTNTTNGMRYYIFDENLSAKGGTELIDFRDANSDAVEDCYAASTDKLGDYTFGNAYGYQFTKNDFENANKVDKGEEILIIDNYDAYKSCNPNWAVSVHLRPKHSNSDEYDVVTVVESKGTAPTLNWQTGDIVMVVHSAASQLIHPETGDKCTNWKSKVAALAIKPGEDTITLSSDRAKATVNVPKGEADPTEQVNVSAKDVQYAVLVYKTTNLEVPGQVETMLRGSDGTTKYWGTNKDVEISTATSDWTYKVLDFSNGYTIIGEDGTETGQQTNWADINPEIQSAGIRFITNDIDYEFMISHFAMFETEGEAKAYGEKALVYNMHHIHEIYPHAEYSTDFTTGEVHNSNLETKWLNGAYNLTKYDTETGANNAYYEDEKDHGRKHYTFSGIQYGQVELIDFTDMGGIDSAKGKYAVVVIKPWGNTSINGTDVEVKAFIRSQDEADGGYGKVEYTESKTAPVLTGGPWIYRVFNCSNISVGDKIYSAGINISNENYTELAFDVSHFAMFATEEEAEEYGKKALEYNDCSGLPYAFYNPIYNNLGYGLLVGSHNNPLYPEKYSDRIGYTFIPEKEYNEDGTETGNTYFEKAHSSISDMIYYLEAGKGSNLDINPDKDYGFIYDGNDMSTLPFDGYTLFTKLTEGMLTAGMLEGTIGKDGTPVYREGVIDYLAKLLATTLTIPEYKDGRFNYDFIRGKESDKYAGKDGKAQDLASAIRDCIGIDFDNSVTEVNHTVIIDGVEYNNLDTMVQVTIGENELTRTINGQKVSAKLNLDKTEYKAGVLAAMISGQNMISVQTINNKKVVNAKWSDCKKYIGTCYDAAYYLLNTIFVANSYNEAKDDFEYLVLNKTETTEGDEVYVFDAGFSVKSDESNTGYKSALTYDGGIINFAGVTDKAVYYFEKNTPTTLFPFLPIIDANNEKGMTKSPYFADEGVGYDGTYGGTYWERDFNYVIKSSGEFVYHEDDNLFFEFEGDDDVYLFINGELVLDIGGAHSITKERIEIKDYVNAAKENRAGDADRNDALDLKEGEICTFDFFYMERHGYGANCRIATNMRVTDPGLKVDKTASQNGTPVEYGDSVDPTKLIAYDFALTNVGDVKLKNIIFEDTKIGVKLDYENGLDINPLMQEYVRNKNNEPLTESDLKAVVTGFELAGNTTDPNVQRYTKTTTGMVEDKAGKYVATKEITVDFSEYKDSKEALKKFMAILDGKGLGSGDGEENAGAGLWAYSTVKITGIHYKMTPEQVKEKRFDNILEASAETIPLEGEETKELHSQDAHRVYVSNELTYYQWAKHELVVDKDELIGDLVNSAPNLTEEKVKGIKLEENTSEVTLNEEGTLTIEYTDANSVLRKFNLIVDYKSAPLDQVETIKNVQIPETYGADIIINEEGEEEVEFDNAYGYTFNIDYVNGVIGGEDATIITTESAYSKCNPNWAVSVQLRPTGTSGKYEVVKKVVSPVTAEGAGIIWGNGDIVMVVHSSASLPGQQEPYTNKECVNWMSKVAAAAIEPGDVLTVSDDRKTVTVDSEQIVPVKVIVTDVQDSAYVLDYGLSVDMTKDGSLFAKDKLTVEGHGTKSEMLAVGNETPTYADNKIEFTAVAGDDSVVEVSGTEGKFELAKASQSLTYTPTEFMNDEDSLYVAVLVHDAKYNGKKEIGTVDINKEVQMYKEVSVLPANVVYYEDDFAAVHYVDKNGNDITENEAIFERVGSSEGLTQSTDQTQEYGKDDAYSNNSDKSGNSLTKITINASGRVAYFEFTGTGFELISRTNAFDSATLSVKVKDKATGTLIKNIPVITEFDNLPDGGTEEIYQVPVIRVNDLEHGTYTVEISGVPARDYTKVDGKYVDPDGNPTEDGKPYIKPTILYIDGFRVFQPLAKDNQDANKYYNEAENGAIFEEIRDLIVNGQAAVVTYEEDTDKLSVSTGTATWTENRKNTTYDGREFVGNRVDSVNDYLALGPNNEVYMQAGTDENTDSKSALVFYVKENETDKGNLQIAFRTIDQALFNGEATGGNASAKVSYGVDINSKKYWTEAIETHTATEQYYTIDYKTCPKLDDGRYQVAIKVDEGMISYSSLKLNGLTISTMDGKTEGDVPSLIFNNGVLVEKSSGDIVNGEIHPAFGDLALQFATKDTIGFDEIDNILGENGNEGETEFNPIRYQTRYNRDVRLIAYVDDLSKYTKVIFEIKIPDGKGGYKTSNPLVCTTAYNKLYAGNVEKTTEDIYGGKEGYFVTFTINNYLTAYRGEVEITVRYYNGETKVDEKTRKVSIGTEVSE